MSVPWMMPSSLTYVAESYDPDARRGVDEKCLK